MPEKPSSALLQRMQADGAATRAASLDDLHAIVRSARDMELEIENLEERTKDAKEELRKLKEEKLVELFTAAGVKLHELAPEGNSPGYVAKLKPFWNANIAASWDEDKRGEAFDWLSEHGHGDLIKRSFVVEFSREDGEAADKFREALDQLKVVYEEKMSVHAGTLTAWFKEQDTKQQELPPLELIGARRGQVVEIKPVKEKKGK